MHHMKHTTLSKSIIFTCLLWIGQLLIAGTTAFAQEVNLAVSPPTAYLKVKQGSSATHTVVIENLSDQPLKVTPKIVDFSSDNQSNIPILSDTTTFPYFDSDPQSLAPLSLGPKSKAQLTLTITVPPGVPNQEFPLTVLFQSEQDTSFVVAAGSTQVSGTIGSNLIVLVSSDTVVTPSLEISSFKTSSIVDSFRPLHFTPEVTNTGYAAAAASGSAQILDWQGKVIKEFPLRTLIILGNSKRNLETDTVDGLATTSFSYKPLLLLGIYKISIDLIVQNQDQPIHLLETKTIFALPLFLLGALTIFIIAWLINTYYLRRK